MDLRFIQTPSITALEQQARARILQASERAIEQRGAFRIVLAGGATPKNVYASLRNAQTSWARWEIFFGDERCLPLTHHERNSLMAQNAWLDHVPIPRENVHTIPAEWGPDEGALRTHQRLRGCGLFDLVLLGLGEDGHTASLFPGQRWGTESDSDDALPVHTAPKPPKERVSLSAHRLSLTREALFLVSGESKRRAVQAFRAHDPALPASAIRPACGVDVLVTTSLLDPDA